MVLWVGGLKKGGLKKGDPACMQPGCKSSPGRAQVLAGHFPGAPSHESCKLTVLWACRGAAAADGPADI